MEETRYVRKEFRHIAIKLMLLKKIKSKKTYSYEMVKEISKVAPKFIDRTKLRNDIYNTLASLEKSGYIKMTAKVDGGRLKNYYSLTKEGERVLKSAKKMFMNVAKLFK